jgi:hypothetical protein
VSERKLTDGELIDALCEIEFGLSGWEIDFVESLAKQIEAGRTLTDRQREKAEAILEAKG